MRLLKLGSMGWNIVVISGDIMTVESFVLNFLVIMFTLPLSDNED